MKKILLLIIVIGVLVPLSTVRAWVQTGEPCFPSVTKSESGAKASNPTLCPLDKKTGTTLINIAWDLSNGATVPAGTTYCVIDCSRPNESCGSFNAVDKDGFLTSSAAEPFLEWKGSIKVKNPYSLESYKVRCCEKKKVGFNVVNSCESGSPWIYSAPIQFTTTQGWGACVAPEVLEEVVALPPDQPAKKKGFLKGVVGGVVKIVKTTGQEVKKCIIQPLAVQFKTVARRNLNGVNVENSIFVPAGASIVGQPGVTTVLISPTIGIGSKRVNRDGTAKFPPVKVD